MIQFTAIPYEIVENPAIHNKMGSQKSKPRFNREKTRFNRDEYNFNGINLDVSEILS